MTKDVDAKCVSTDPQRPHLAVPEDLLPGYLHVGAELARMAERLWAAQDADSEPAQVFNLQTLLR